MELIVDITPAPVATVDVDPVVLASVSMDLAPLSILEFNQGLFAQVDVPIFPEFLTEDFLTSNNEFLTSDGEALTW